MNNTKRNERKVIPSTLPDHRALSLPPFDDNSRNPNNPPCACYSLRLPTEVATAVCSSEGSSITFETRDEGYICIPGLGNVPFKCRAVTDGYNQTAQGICFSRRGTLVRNVGPIFGDIEMVENRPPRYNPKKRALEKTYSDSVPLNLSNVNENCRREPSKKRSRDCSGTSTGLCSRSCSTPSGGVALLRKSNCLPLRSTDFQHESADDGNNVIRQIPDHPSSKTSQVSNAVPRLTLPSLPLLKVSAPAPTWGREALRPSQVLGSEQSPTCVGQFNAQNFDELKTKVWEFEKLKRETVLKRPQSNVEESYLQNLYKSWYAVYDKFINRNDEIRNAFMGLLSRYERCRNNDGKESLIREIRRSHRELKGQKRCLEHVLPSLHKWLKSISDLFAEKK